MFYNIQRKYTISLLKLAGNEISRIVAVNKLLINYLYLGENFQASSGEDQMMNAIKSGGSISIRIGIYSDFKYYSGGIYYPSPNARTYGSGGGAGPGESPSTYGGHIMRIFGWGERTCNDGTYIKYWLGVSENFTTFFFHKGQEIVKNK